MTKVITWVSPAGQTINVCRKCEARLTAAREWPRDGRGDEYCQVHRGLHRGECDIEDCPVSREASR
jgi:hypothetical protein